MKKLISLLLIALLTLLPTAALAETAGGAAGEAAGAVEETAGEAAEAAVTDAAEETAAEAAEAAVTDAAEEAAAETAEATEEAAEEETESFAEQHFGDFLKLHWYTLALIAVLLIGGIIICLRHSGAWNLPSAALAILCFGAAAALAIVSVVNYVKADPWQEIQGSVNAYLAVIAVLLAVMVLIICLSKDRKWDARTVAYAAMSIAISFVLSMIKLFRMPQGGAVTPAAMLPLILFAMSFGPSKGLIAGCAYGLLQLIEDPYVIHPIQLLVDYPMAFGALALCCAARPLRNERLRLPLGVLLGYLGRYIMAVLSGVVFFAAYAGEQNALIYSLGYNISYMGIEAVIACVIACIPGFGRILDAMNRKGAH